MRGWPNTFWALTHTTGPAKATFTMIVLFAIGNLFVMNMFIAVVISLLKNARKVTERKFWLSVFPGDLDMLAELDLLLWIKKNNKAVMAAEQMHNSKSTNWIEAVRRFYEYITDRDFGSEFKPVKKRSNASLKKDKTTLQEQMELADQDDEEDMMVTKVQRKAVALANAKDAGNDGDARLTKKKKKITFLVPNCTPFKFMRRMYQNPRGKFNILITILVWIDLIVFSTTPSTYFYGINLYEEGMKINEALCIIFFVDLLFRILAFGPYRYFLPPWNLLEAFFILFAMGSLYSSHHVCTYANIFRVFRTFRVKSPKIHTTSTKKNDGVGSTSPPMSLAQGGVSYKDRVRPALSSLQLYKILKDSFFPVMSYVGALLLFIYVFALIGMRVIGSYTDDDAYSQNFATMLEHINTGPQQLATNTTVLLNLPEFRVVEEMANAWHLREFVFSTFSHAYVTMFSLAFLNNWYHVMILNMLKSTRVAFWFFFVWLIISNYILAPVLVAQYIVQLEKQALEYVRTLVDSNQELLGRIHFYQQKATLHHYFQILKQNTVASDTVTSVGSGGGASTRNKVNLIKEDVVKVEEVQSFWKRKEGHTLYLFEPEGDVRTYMIKFIKSRLFNLIICVSILITALFVVTDADTSLVARPALRVSLFYLALGAFYMEMCCKLIAYGFYGSNRAYLASALNWFDMGLNIIGIFVVLDNKFITPAMIIRLVKMPSIIQYLVKNKSFQQLVQSTKNSVKSLLLVVSISLAICFFFAVLGMQFWQYGFGYCSYKDYPKGYARDSIAYANYPNGCNGTRIFNLTETVQASTKLEWWYSDDDYSTLMYACQSVFKVIMMNNWSELLFFGTSYDGWDRQPRSNHSPGAFLFYFVLAIVGSIINVMFASVIFYHYQVHVLTGGTSFVFRQEDVIWREMEIALRFVPPITDHMPPDAKASPTAHKIFKFTHRYDYRVVSAFYAIIPLFLMFAAYDSSYGQARMTKFDGLYSIAYIIEFFIRMYATGPSIFMSVSAGKQEAALIGLHFLSIGFTAADYLTGFFPITSFRLVLACVVFRMYRLALLFPRLRRTIRVFISSMNAFVPLFVSIVCIYIFYAVIGTLLMGDVPVVLENEFMDDHYHFKDYFHSVITILAMSTGNLWSEIMNELILNGPDWKRPLINFYFITFYLIINCIFRAFVILLIAKFLERSSDHSALAAQQIHQFRLLWRKIERSHKYFSDRSQLKRFLIKLKAPLGISPYESRAFNALDRFYRLLTLNHFFLNQKDWDLDQLEQKINEKM